MEKKKRCNLCGAKLKGDICSECGYNNAAYNYKVNSAEDYCTHSSSETFYSGREHQEHTNPEADPPSMDSWDYSQLEEMLGEEYGEEQESTPNEAPVTYGLNEKRTEKKKKKGKWVKWLVLICFLPTILELITGLVGNVMESDIWKQAGEIFTDEKNSVENAGNPEITAEYEKASAQEAAEELPAGEAQVQHPKEVSEEPAMAAAGGNIQISLGPGIYMAGLHLPAGIYDAELVSGSGSVYVQNMEENYWESDYLYERSSKKEQKMEDLRLTQGTLIKITDELWMNLSTQESQGYLADTTDWENFLTDPVKVRDGMIAGEDFPAGTYCLTCTSREQGTAMLIYKYLDHSGYEDYEQIMFFEGTDRVENITFAEGDVLMELNCEITLIPAEFDLSDTVVW